MNTRVYKFGCRAPREHALALQLLGQAANYAESIRRIYNDRKRDARELLASGDDVSHVIRYGYEAMRAAMRDARLPEKRGHLLDCGTYWLVEAAMLAADKASKLDPIKRADWDATGRIGAAIQSVSQFSAEDLPWKHPRVTLSEPNAKKHAELTVRIGNLADGLSITWPIKLHRPFPPGAIVKQVAVQRTRVGHRYRWEVLVTIGAHIVDRDAEASGVVGVDVGWRAEGARGIRVATHDAADDAGELHVDTAEAYAYSDAVRGYRDDAFNAAKEYVAEAGLAADDEHPRMWRDKDRMHRLALKTENLGLRLWRERDRHLEDIECGVRARAIRRRLDTFRCYADALAKRYRILVLEDMPMLDWVGEAPTSTHERRRSTAALALLQNVLVHRFGEDRVDWAPAEYTSMVCSSCGVTRAEPVGPRVHWVCACGAEHHQDYNAAANLRTMGERWRDDGNPVRARKRKARKGKKEPEQTEKGVAAPEGTACKPIAEAAE